VNNLLRAVLYWILFAFCLLPGLPLAWGWVGLIRRKTPLELTQMALLTFISASFTWTLLVQKFPLLLGPFHSDARQLLIAGNCLIMTLVGIAAFIRKKEITETVLAAAATALVWGYLAVINVPV
jgi:hypothetical protein